jgi:hypothetical protein
VREPKFPRCGFDFDRSARRIISFSPFTPFIVLLCHSMETGVTEDYDLIDQFMCSIEPLRNSSAHADKMFLLCQALSQLAVAYVQAQRQRDGNVESRPRTAWDESAANARSQGQQSGQAQVQVQAQTDLPSFFDDGVPDWAHMSGLTRDNEGLHIEESFAECLDQFEMSDFVAPDWLRGEMTMEGL